MSLNAYLKMQIAGSLNVNLLQIQERRILCAQICWRDGYITDIRHMGAENPELPYLLPGFVDAHVHIESAMLTPCEFARLAVRHGTVAAVCDPHEIANVLGLTGVHYMLDNAKLTPFLFAFGAPACVPATEFETAGGRLEAEQLAELFQQPQVRCLSEVMNYPGVINQEPALLAKLALAKRLGLPIDGHAPGLMGEALQAYAAAGISTDHECQTLAEAEAKIALGMKILIREGSAARNFDALQPLISRYPQQVMFCSDDKHPDDLQQGHINHLVARAVALGHDVFDVLRCACLNPLQHYGLPAGRLQVGDRMDAVLVDDLHHFTPLKTWIAGQCVADQGISLLSIVKPQALNRFNARKIQPEDFKLADTGDKVRVIAVQDGELLTEQLSFKPHSQDGWLQPALADDVLWLLVLNRYQPAKPALAFIKGFGLRQGALASSVAHDSHNIVAVGTDAAALCQAVNALIESQGGIACVSQGRLSILPLPIAGLMSDADGDHVAQSYAELNRQAKRMGCPLRAPFMSLSFMALLVIPKLKLSDRGLFDGQRFAFTDLFISPHANA